MGKFVKILSFSFLLILFGLIFTPHVHAEGEFGTSYNTTYDIDDKGATHVIQKITLENKTTQLYATQFTLTIGAVKISNPRAFDDKGTLPLVNEFVGGNTQLKVTFNQKVVGQGKKLTWTLVYDSPETASRSGQIWEIGIPKLATVTDIDAYDVTLSVPRSFGQAVFITPQPKSIEDRQSLKKVYKFDRDQLKEKGVAASFGDKQIYTFNLKYNLQNTNLVPISTDIALPPDNAYQKVYLNKLDPKPVSIAEDKDGNWIATYQVAPRSKIMVDAEGFVETHHQPVAETASELSSTEKSAYLQPQKYWDVDNPRLKAKAAELKTPKAIYDFVVSYLSYNEKRLEGNSIERLGAQSAFDNPTNSVCMEFTDLFITLARSAGIPAREIDGYAYSANDRLKPLSLKSEGDILHAWPEYFDDKLGWVQVDPTWGSTSGGLDFFSKLDFNHITFVQKGYSSTSPFPAGSYKLAEKPNSKDVSVLFALGAPEKVEDLTLSINLAQTGISLIPLGGSVALENKGNTAFAGGLLTINTQHSQVSPENNFKVTKILPYSTQSIDFSLRNINLFASSSDTVKFNFAGQETVRTVKFVALPAARMVPIFGGIVIIMTVLSIVFVKKRRA